MGGVVGIQEYKEKDERNPKFVLDMVTSDVDINEIEHIIVIRKMKPQKNDAGENIPFSESYHSIWSSGLDPFEGIGLLELVKKYLFEEVGL